MFNADEVTTIYSSLLTRRDVLEKRLLDFNGSSFDYSNVTDKFQKEIDEINLVINKIRSF